MASTETAIDIANRTAAAIGVEPPGSLRAQSGLAPQALALLNRTGQELATKRGSHGQSWPELTKDGVVTTAVGQQWYPLPQDFAGVIRNTAWNVKNEWPAPGPANPAEWQALRNSVAGAYTTWYRVAYDPDARAVRMNLFPEPEEVFDLSFAYLSNLWVRETAGGPISGCRVSRDTDVPIFPSILMETGLEFRLRKAHGLSFAGELAEYETLRDRLFGQATRTRTVQSGAGYGEDGLYPTNVPEGNWGIVA